MRTSALGILSVLTALLLSAAAAAAPPGPTPGVPPVPRLFGTFEPVVGAWSEYAVVDKASGRRSRMKMAIVGSEKNAFWYEVTLHEGGDRNVVKMLVKGNPNDPENIQRMIFKSGDEPATEMPREFVAMGRKMATHMFERRSGVSASDPGAIRVVEGEKRRITVPAGTFDAVRHEIKDAEGRTLATYEFNPDVLPFGVLRSDAGDTSMELLAHGRDARSSITEKPVPMGMPPGMPGALPRGIPPGMGAPGGGGG